jgi:hypothetical protein
MQLNEISGFGGESMEKKPTKKSPRHRPGADTQAPGADVCFVIMPFGGWLDDYYDKIYRPAIDATGLKPHRADDLYRPSTIVNDIWAYTRQAKLLIADLTGKNPNVFYELGLAHALAKPAILIAEAMEDIPFDLRALRIIVYYKNHPHWGELLQAKLEAAIKEVLKSPQEAVLPAFLQVRESSGTRTVTQREKDIIEIKQELDLLRREVRDRSLGIGRTPHASIQADEARAMILSYLGRGMSEDAIFQRLLPLGPPEDWIRDQIAHFRSRRPVAPEKPEKEPTMPNVANVDKPVAEG